MNPQKTDFILIGTRQTLSKVENFHICIAESDLKPSPTIKLLGLTVDSCLAWDANISHIVRRCNALLISLSKFRHHFDQETLKLLIETHVFPHILYCISVWGGTTKKSTHSDPKTHQLQCSDRDRRAASGEDRAGSGIPGLAQSGTAGAGEGPAEGVEGAPHTSLPSLHPPHVCVPL